MSHLKDTLDASFNARPFQDILSGIEMPKANMSSGDKKTFNELKEKTRELKAEAERLLASGIITDPLLKKQITNHIKELEEMEGY